MQREMTRGGGGGGRPSSRGGPRSQGAREDRDQTPSINVKEIVFGQITPRLYSDVAENAAKAVSPGQKASKNKPTQLRRFYDELVMLQEKAGSNPERFSQQEPFIQMLKAKVAYAKGREKVDENFEALLRHVVDQIKDPTTLKQAKLFMEAFMAFYKVYGPKD